jgi:hypothetical protein
MTELASGGRRRLRRDFLFAVSSVSGAVWNGYKEA